MDSSEKYEILKELDAGAKRSFLERKHGISYGTLAGFLNNRATIEASIASASNLDSKSTKLSLYPEIDTALLEWFRYLKSTAPEETVTGPFLLEKSKCIAEKVKTRNVPGYLEPVFFDLNWVERWKNAITSPTVKSRVRANQQITEVLTTGYQRS